MPIKELKTTSVNTTLPVQASNLESNQQAAFYSLMEGFLILNPTPTDEQVHTLSSAVGMDHETFEALIYECFGDVLKHQDASDDILDDEEDDDEGDEDDSEEEVNEGAHHDLMARLTSSNVDDMPPMNKGIFDVDDLQDPEDITSADEDGRAAANDGAPDLELHGVPDPLKEAAESDGAVDEDVVNDTYDVPSV